MDFSDSEKEADPDQPGFAKFKDLVINKFFPALRKKKIMAERDWFCCANCGHEKIRCIIRDDYYAYVFYHNYEGQNIIDQLLKEPNRMPEVKLCWQYFQDKDLKKDPEGKKLAARIKKIGNKFGLKVDFIHINSVLTVH